MKKKVFGILVSLSFVVMLALPMSFVFAVKPNEIVDCTFTINIGALTITPVKGLTGNSDVSIVNLEGTDFQTWSGDISGVADYSARWVYHGVMGVDENAFLTLNGLYIFDEATVTVGDVTAVGALVLRGAGNKAHPSAAWTVLSSDLVIQGTDEPISLHGQGEIIMLNLDDYDVVGQLQFGP